VSEIDKDIRNAKVWGVMIGKFSPMHRAQTRIFRKLAPFCDQLFIFVAGLKESVENPFSFDLRKKIITNSLGPLSYKANILPATIKREGKVLQTGYIKSLLQKINAMQRVDAIFVFVGQDRYRDFSKQLEEIQKDAKRFNKVRVINGGVQLNEFGEKINATSLRGALLANDAEYIKRYLAPPIADNPTLFKEIYDQMKREMEETYDSQQFEKVVKKSNKTD